jgi:hypothetical protein
MIYSKFGSNLASIFCLLQKQPSNGEFWDEFCEHH